MDEIFLKNLAASKDWLMGEYSGIRTGQAAPALLDSIKVENYGAKAPLNQVASVSAEDARTLRVSPWDAGTIPAIEKAINEANLGVSVASDSSGLRVMFPELTSERRVQLEKLAKSKLEDARVRVKTARDEAVKSIEAAEKSGDISKDEKFSQREKMQEKVDAANKELESVYESKAKEISS